MMHVYVCVYPVNTYNNIHVLVKTHLHYYNNVTESTNIQLLVYETYCYQLITFHIHCGNNNITTDKYIIIIIQNILMKSG